MSHVLVSLSESTRVGDVPIFSLRSDGSVTKGSAAAAAIDVQAFLGEWRERLQRIIAAKREGWDQLRIASETTCQPIYNFEVRLSDGEFREFGVYAEPHHGAVLEDGTHLPAEIAELYAYCRR